MDCTNDGISARKKQHTYFRGSPLNTAFWQIRGFARYRKRIVSFNMAPSVSECRRKKCFSEVGDVDDVSLDWTMAAQKPIHVWPCPMELVVQMSEIAALN